MALIGEAIAIAEAIFNVVEVVDDFRKAPSEISQFKDQIRALLSTLSDLEKEFESYDAKSKEKAQRIFRDLMLHMRNLQKQLEGNYSTFRKIWHRLTWGRKKTGYNQAFDKIGQFTVHLHTLQEGVVIKKVSSIQANEHTRRVSAVFDKLTPRLAGDLQMTPTRAKSITTGTGKWFFSEDEVRKWQWSRNGILWVNGIQGTGKTGLMTIFGDKLVENAGKLPSYHVARVYCDHKVLANLDNHFDIIMSLWRQLVKSTKFTLDSEALEDLELKLAPGGFPSAKMEEELKISIFGQTMAYGGNTILIVDGLDEVPENFQEPLVQDLKTLHQQNQYCRLLFTSRPYSSLRQLFENVPKFSLKATEIDIQLYIADRISRQRPGTLFHQPEIKQRIIDTLTKRCKGTFLMAKLLMDDVLRATSEDDCNGIIENLPHTLTEAYDRGLERLAQTFPSPHQPTQSLPCLPIIALFWVAFAPAPMTDRQLKQALAVNYGDTDYNNTREAWLGIDALCGELLIVDPQSGIVREAHKSITDHLTTYETRNRFFSGIREHIHTILMHYLRLECMRKPTDGTFSRTQFRKRYPLAGYAVKHWGHRLNDILEPDTPLWSATQEFLQTPFSWWNEYISSKAAAAMGQDRAVDLKILRTGNLSGLHWIVHFELDRLIPAMVDYERQVPVVNAVPITPLGLAAAQHRMNMAEKLIEYGVGITHDGHMQQPLYNAVWSRSKNIVSLLLRNGADMTLRQRYDNQSPLDAAYRLDNGDVASVLAKSISGQSSTTAQELQFLVKGAFATELERVLDEGLAVNHPCENGKLALDYAHELKNQRIIEILTARGATTKLTWPAFPEHPHQHPQNLPANWNHSPAIIAQKSWDIDNPFRLHRAVEGEPDRVESETEGERDDNIKTSVPFSDRLLEVPVDKRIKLPLQSIVFESVSKDQGWSSHTNQLTYLGSENSWLDVCVTHQDKRSQSFMLQGNVQASDELRMHTNIWNLSELESSYPAKADFMRSIQYGSTLTVSAHVKGGFGWDNVVTFVRVRLYGADGGKPIGDNRQE